MKWTSSSSKSDLVDPNLMALIVQEQNILILHRIAGWRKAASNLGVLVDKLAPEGARFSGCQGGHHDAVRGEMRFIQLYYL